MRVFSIAKWFGAAAVMLTLVSCRREAPPEPAVATPSLTVNHPNAPIGSPIEVTYKFVVADNAKFDENYRVFVGFVGPDEELMWTDDHDPPVPTTQWKPGQTIEYTRTVFVPVYPYVGDASIHLGLHSTKDQHRLTLAGDDAGQHAYRVGKIQMQPQTENLFTVFKDGWHPAELSGDNDHIEWQWTKKNATLAVKNPKKATTFYLELDSPVAEYHGTQQIQISVGGQQLDSFTLNPNQRELRKIPVTAEQLGGEEMVEFQLAVDPTFIPIKVNPSSKDPRELGVRVFHVFVDAR